MTQPNLDELVRLARRDRPTPAALSSIARSLRLPFVATAPLVAVAAPSSALAAALGKLGLSRAALLSWGAGSAAVVSGVTAAVLWSQEPAVTPPAPTPPPVVEQAPEAPQPAPATPISEVAPAPATSARKPSKEAAAVWDEPRLIERARKALGSDPRRALALAQEHQRRFPAGALALEREVIVIEALARSGQSAEARQRALAFEARYPKSIHSPRIRALAERLGP